MIIDEADHLFQRKKDLVDIINASWTRGTPIPRTLPGQGGIHRFDVFCPKIIGMVGMKVPGTTATSFHHHQNGAAIARGNDRGFRVRR